MKIRITKKRLLVILCLMLAVFFLLEQGSFNRRMQWYRSWIKLQTLELFLPKATHRVMVIAPHPDDEILACGGLIHDLIQESAEVFVIFVTNGEGFGDYLLAKEHQKDRHWGTRVLLGYERQDESLLALSHLGVSYSNVFFLSYPDGGIDKLWFSNYEIPYRSPHTREEFSPFDNSFTPGAFNTGEQLAWPRPWGIHSELPLLPPPSLLLKNLIWEEYPLSPMAYEAKSKALAAFTSQTPFIGQFLYAFLRTNELFCKRDPLSRTIYDPRGDFAAKEIFRNADFTLKEISFQEEKITVRAEVIPRRGLPGIKYLAKLVLFYHRDNYWIEEERIHKTLSNKNTIFKDQELVFDIDLQDELKPFMIAISLESVARPFSLAIDKTPWSLVRLEDPDDN